MKLRALAGELHGRLLDGRWRCRCPPNPGGADPSINEPDVALCTLCNTYRPGADSDRAEASARAAGAKEERARIIVLAREAATHLEKTGDAWCGKLFMDFAGLLERGP